MLKRSVVVVDDHPIVRQGFVQLINLERNLEVVGEAEHAGQALEIISSNPPDLALIDLSLKESNGLELIKDIHRLFPKLPLLVISLHDEHVYAERALRAGAKGYIMKSEATENVMVAIKKVLEGEIYLSDAMSSKMIERFAGNKEKPDSPIDILSDRELEVFQMIGSGLKTKTIADALCLSVKTIETYKSHLKTKLKVNDSTELMQYAVEWTIKNER